MAARNRCVPLRYTEHVKELASSKNGLFVSIFYFSFQNNNSNNHPRDGWLCHISLCISISIHKFCFSVAYLSQSN